MNRNIVFGIAAALLFFILPLFLGNLALHQSQQALTKIEKRQVVLTHTADQLGYLIKQQHALVLQMLLLPKPDAVAKIEASRLTIDANFEELKKFSALSDKVEVKKTVEIIGRRLIGFHAVELTLLDANSRQDPIDTEDALLGYNSITDQFLKDVTTLNNVAQKCLIRTIGDVEKTNRYVQTLVLVSFLFALILAYMTIKNILKLKHNAEEQLQRAVKAEASLSGYLQMLEAEVDKKTSQERFRYYHNSLTHLPNRTKFLEDLQTEGYRCAALYNLDKFQEFNDLFGETIGDEAIKKTGKILDRYKNRHYRLYHLGGDEFVLAAKDQLKEVFIAESRKLLERLNQTEFHYNKEPYNILCSVGIAAVKERLLACADIALKEAKRSGNSWVFYDDSMAAEKSYEDNIQCSKRLIEALAQDRVQPYFQPIAHCCDGSIDKYEALVRILLEDGTAIPPVRFLTIAKRLRLYPKITEVMFFRTLEHISRYHISCSMNISAEDIHNTETAEMLLDALETFDACHLLTLEILESVVIDNYESVKLFIDRVRQMGVQVALDDFGSGYSNFSHALNLSVDVIKIDASLISQIEHDENSRIMTETIVALAKRLQVKTVAEYVSNAGIYAVMQEIGVDYVQGFYIGEPAPITAFFASGVEQ